MTKIISITILILSCNFVLLRAQGANNMLKFDGTNDYINITSSPGDELNPQNTITIESWVYLTEAPSTDHRPHYLGKNQSYQLTVETDGYPRFWINSGGTYTFAEGITLIETGKWYHIAGTYDGSQVSIYINGVLENSTALTGDITQNDRPVRFGDREGNEESLSGMMDDIRIWNVARSESQIQQSLFQTLAGDEVNLIGYWMLDAMSGIEAIDATSTNNGVLVNMDGTTERVISTAPIGDTSIFSKSTDIIGTEGCAVDVTFGTGMDAPGPNTATAVIQVNETPNSTTDLYGSVADTYWEIFSEDLNFDGDFTATINFHYDSIADITNESLLTLYRRDNASVTTWTEVSGASIVSDDGASSTETDGIGYAQITITEATVGGFSGQYILAWNNLPVITIPDSIVINEGETFSDITLDDFVTDAEDTDADINWGYTGEDVLGISINSRVVSITTPVDTNWFGSDTITFTATDLNGGSTDHDVIFKVKSVNDLPVISDIPGETIAEDSTFKTINLNNYVTDIEDADDSITWSFTGDNEVTVNINENNVTITAPNADWFGADTIIFTATDRDGGIASDTAIFVATAVNDVPEVSDIPNQTIDEDGTFIDINLAGYVDDVENDDADISWAASDNTNITISITDGVAKVSAPENWFGSETVTFTATDLNNGQDSDEVTFTVNAVNDIPEVSDIPNQTIDEDGTFATITLDDYVVDVENTDADIIWTFTGNTDLSVSIVDRVATITAPENWNGVETITFTATDTETGTASDDVTFTVNSVNDVPVITDIPGETIIEGESFATIYLDEFVSDVENDDADLEWDFSGDNELTVVIDENHVATISVPSADWTGSDTITFTVTDAANATASDTAIFTVKEAVGIDPISSIISMDVYPNPGNGIFSVSTQLSKSQVITLNVYTITGELILNEQYNSGQFGENVYELDLSHVMKGLYLVEAISEDNNRLIKRLVIK